MPAALYWLLFKQNQLIRKISSFEWRKGSKSSLLSRCKATKAVELGAQKMYSINNDG
jgi:hypothetical protein